jgi:hypothetical protein
MLAGDEAEGRLPPQAVDCLIAAASAAPAAFRSHLKALEDHASSVLVSRVSSALARQQAAHLVSLLPRITGEHFMVLQCPASSSLSCQQFQMIRLS